MLSTRLAMKEQPIVLGSASASRHRLVHRPPLQPSVSAQLTGGSKASPCGLQVLVAASPSHTFSPGMQNRAVQTSFLQVSPMGQGAGAKPEQSSAQISCWSPMQPPASPGVQAQAMVVSPTVLVLPLTGPVLSVVVPGVVAVVSVLVVAGSPVPVTTSVAPLVGGVLLTVVPGSLVGVSLVLPGVRPEVTVVAPVLASLELLVLPSSLQAATATSAAARECNRRS